MKYADFTKLYPLSKTLRFELKPIGKTLENIEKDGVLTEDSHRAKSYKKMKKLIDEYHKCFIDSCLNDFCFDEGNLLSLYELYSKTSKTDDEKSKYETLQDNLRKQVALRLTKAQGYKRLFGKELIQEDLGNYADEFLPEDERNECKQLLEEFRTFTTYFTGFHENRKNMYSDEAKSTSIGFRLIHENLPKFIDNIAIFEKIKAVPELAEKFATVYKEQEEYLNVCNIEEMFSLLYFNNVLTQTQITVYNMVIGGRSLEDKTKLQGLNEYINLYNQQQTDKSNRLPKLKPLFKQILSDREAVSWLPEAFEDDNAVLTAIFAAHNEFFVDDKEHGFVPAKQLRELLSNIASYSTTGIFIANDLQLTDISQKMFGSWAVIGKGLTSLMKNAIPRKKKEKDEAYDERIQKAVKAINNYSLTEINSAIAAAEQEGKVEDYFATLGAVNTADEQKENIFSQIQNAFTEAQQLLTTEYKGNLKQDEKSVEKIKTLLDAIKELQRFTKPLLGKKLDGEKDEKFYSELQYLWEALDKFTPLYNKVRNYVTQKPYSTEKIKVNFRNPVLANGWPNPEQTSCVIFRKDGNFYLGILKDRTALRNIEKGTLDDCIEMMHYAQAADPSKDVPNLMVIDGKTVKKNGRKEKTGQYAGQNILLEQLRNKYLPNDINEIRKSKSYSVSSEIFSKADLARYIDFYKERVSEYFSQFKFSFKDSSEYNNFSDFTDHVNSQAYQLNFDQVSFSYLNTLVEEGKIYLFQIYNKDFSPMSKGTPNMHTIYWKMLFDERNLADVVYKLNGEAEVFFRKASIETAKPTHPANLPIKNKNKQNEKKESLFDYDLIKDRRYTVDKFMFHVPITMNFVNKGTNNINESVREYLQQSEDVHIIGIDRGERHLLYLTVIDMQGNIKEQFSLNEIVNEYRGNTYKTNYHDLLDEKERQRQESRQSWKSIETIKELKEGYLSQVVHKITQLMLKYHAIVVLEDLNLGFMRGRQKVEKQVYQKFEKMLIDKLNYLVDKQTDITATTGALNALQLTNKVDTLSQIGKQCGFLFYIPAWNTSKIDPVTGFANLFTSDDLKYTSAEKARAFFCKFDSIRYNTEKDWFEFAFDYSKFTSKADGTREKWTLCTFGPRIKTFRNAEKNSQWDNIEFDLTDEFKSLLNRFNIPLTGNLKEALSEQEKDFFDGKDGQVGFCYLFKMMLQMRNSITGTDIDYLISPAIGSDGSCYDSRNYTGADSLLPANADANGAYNIARKGLMIVNGLKQTPADNLKKVSIATSEATLKKDSIDLTNKAYLRFVQK